MKSILSSIIIIAVFLGCAKERDQQQLKNDLAAIDLLRGEITLCGSGEDQFGSVAFASGCSEKIRNDFNLATALLHSFEYTEAEKIFVKVIDGDPECVMGYWGVAMCNFHPLWSPPNETDLQKGSKIIALGRTVAKPSSKESDYLEAIATIYDQWDSLDHRTRLLKYERACQQVFEKYPNDYEAAIFYALALDASADPTDKTFANQRKAGAILNKIFELQPNHPGVAHYLIHNFDSPELAEEGLSAARKYAAIASASAHAQHMPSHIFTRLGLWDESIQSNIASVSAAQCYAEKSGIKGHWDEELHGLDYLIYAYLQKGDDVSAMEKLNYVHGVQAVEPVNFKGAYSLSAGPARYAVETKDWKRAASLELTPVEFPWDNFLWERSNYNFARLLGAVHLNKLADARKELKVLEGIHAKLVEKKDQYKSNLLMIQIKASSAWIKLKEGKQAEAIALMNEAAFMEEATSKPPVTPGEILPARELLGDMYLEIGDPKSALVEYERDMRKHPNRLNGFYGATLAAKKIGNEEKARKYFQKLSVMHAAASKREHILALKKMM